ncbi:ABC transporter substrate-binding protein [Streptomyces sp. SID8352]|uniref:transporter substrate-binding domain-containing protein n=1 Tax=Streptomyces sp. SID8352 TaxID=2690338 RepID=UPI0013707E54|nr:transporter substrate-binding domain-containing protein [Streptomyces sp. SID8352]
MRKTGVIRHGLQPGFPPFEQEVDGKIEGFDVELMKALAGPLGVRTEIVAIDSFAGLIPALSARRVDVIVSGMTDTAERREQVTFVNYFNNRGAIMVPSGNPKEINEATDLCGLDLAIEAGWIGEERMRKQSQECKKAGKSEINIGTYPSAPEAVLALRSKQVDAYTLGYAAAQSYVTPEKGKQVHVEIAGQLPDEFGRGQYSIGLAKGDLESARAFRDALDKLIEEGTYQKLLEKYGLTEGAVEKATINGGEIE